MATSSFSAAIFVLLLYLFDLEVQASIGCFTCSSVNGSDPSCEDPFHPDAGHHYQRMCWQTMKGRVGEFPAKYCTKIKGVNARTKIEMVVRACGMEALDNTCVTFYFEQEQYYGCLMSCKTNACNRAPGLVVQSCYWPLRTAFCSCLVLLTRAFLQTERLRLAWP